jgi:hypothetical protein
MTNFNQLTFELLGFILSRLRCSKFKQKFLQACKCTRQLYDSTPGRLAFRNLNVSGNPLLERIHVHHRCLNGACGPRIMHAQLVNFSAQCCFHPEVRVMLSGREVVRYVCCSALCNRYLQHDIRNTHITCISYKRRGFCCHGYSQAEGATCLGCSKTVGPPLSWDEARRAVGPHLKFLFGAAGRTGPTGTQIEIRQLSYHGDTTTWVQLAELVWITQPITFHVGVDLNELRSASQQMFYDETLD